MSASRRADALTVGIVGAGRVGAVVGAALRAAGHHVAAVSAVSAASRERARLLLPGVPVRPLDEVVRSAADLLLLAVPDDALQAVAAVAGSRRTAHVSGAHGVAALGAADGLALHPAMTFTGTAADLARLPGIAWGVTARDRAFATRLVADLGGVPEWIAEQARPLYHAALAHGSNHLVTLVNEAADLLREAGVSRTSAVLAPLLRAALENALAMGDDALTGPVSRGDAGTVARHLREIPTSAAGPYLALARRTADRAIASGRLRPEDAEALMGVLAMPVLTGVDHD